MGGLPCYKVVINSQAIAANLERLASFAQDTFDGKFDVEIASQVFPYPTLADYIQKLDEITKVTLAMADDTEARFRVAAKV